MGGREWPGNHQGRSRDSRRVRLVVLLLAALLAGCATPFQPSGDESVTFQGLRFETRLGAFTAIVFENDTPATAEFIGKLVDAKYYDGRQFGRVIPGFVIQEVDRTGGTTDQKEHVRLEAPSRVMFSAGAFGIARDADPNSGGSEFFVMDHATSSLYGNYTAFAQVVEGMEVVHAIARVPAVKTGPASSVVGAPPGSPVYFGVHDRVPVDPVVMTKVTRVEVTLPLSEAAKYPLIVGETTRTDTLRMTPEWTADLREAHEGTVTWWVSARDVSPTGQAKDPDPPSLDGMTVAFDGPAPAAFDAPEVDANVGSVQVTWTPGAVGVYEARLLKNGEVLARATLVVTA